MRQLQGDIYHLSIDTSAIELFPELISEENERLTDTCETTGKLIYKNKGQEIFAAQLSIVNIGDSLIKDFVHQKQLLPLHHHETTDVIL